MCKKLLIKYVIEFILIIMKKIREKNRSVASGLSVIDFERGERAEGERAQKESCLEDSTERSESNPGRSLGIITSSKKELSGRQYHDLNKHPRQSALIRVRFTTEIFFFRTRIYRIQRMLRSVGGTVFQTKLGNG